MTEIKSLAEQNLVTQESLIVGDSSGKPVFYNVVLTGSKFFRYILLRLILSQKISLSINTLDSKASKYASDLISRKQNI